MANLPENRQYNDQVAGFPAEETRRSVYNFHMA